MNGMLEELEGIEKKNQNNLKEKDKDLFTMFSFIESLIRQKTTKLFCYWL